MEWKPLLVGFAKVALLTGNIVGQAMQNICLPLALSDGDDMSVVLTYMCFVYFCFFAIVDVLLDFAIGLTGGAFHLDFNSPDEKSELLLLNVGFQNALNGVGAIFGGSSQRLPLTLQMTFSLLTNLLSPFYKMWVYGIGWRNFFLDRSLLGWFFLASLLYFVTFILTLVDKLDHVDSGSFNAFGLFFVGGVFFGMTYNVHQDKLMRKIPFAEMTVLQAAKTCTALLRKQLTWLFLFSWLSILLSCIPNVDQSGTFDSDRFLKSWADFITFKSMYMNLFNAGYIMCFITSVFLNKFDSSFNMLTSNVSAALSLWTGWLPSIRMQTVGFFPSLGYTVPAIILSCVAIAPSYWYSKRMKRLVQLEGHDDSTEKTPLVTNGRGVINHHG